MKTLTKTLALVVAAVAFTACSAPTIDPVRPATSIVMPVTPGQPQPIADQLNNSQPATERPGRIAPELPIQSDQQPATASPVPQPLPRPAYQPSLHKPAQLTVASDSLAV